MDYGSTAGMARFIEDKNEIDYIFSKYVFTEHKVKLYSYTKDFR